MNKKHLKKIVILTLPIFFIIGILIFLNIWASSHFINVSVAGVSLNYKNIKEAQSLLEPRITEYLNKEFIFVIENEKNKKKLADIGISVNLIGTLEEILLSQNGSSSNYFNNLYNQLNYFFKHRNIGLKITLDEKKLESVLNNDWMVFQELPQNAKIEKYQNDFLLHPAKNGKLINKESLKKELFNFASHLKDGEIILKTNVVEPVITNEHAKKILFAAKELIQKRKFLLKYQDETWQVPKEVIYDIIKFTEKDGNLTIEANKEEIKNFLSHFAPQVAQLPKNAVLSFTDAEQEVKIVSKDQNGRELEIKESADSFEKAFNNGKDIIEISIKEIPARLREDNIKELGINTLLGKGSTNFSGSAASRVHNIKIGAAKFNGILLAPQEEFSFNKILGNIGPKEGYLPALVIKDDKTIPEYGGGLCQVSTTMFQAAVKSGLKITERSAHAYPVSFYKPVGFDATIYSPYTDLKFINTTRGYIYIQSEVKGNEISFYIFGLNEGNKVKLKGPVVYEKNDDGSMKTVLTQEIYDKDDQLLYKKSFYSNYKSPSLYPILRNPLE